MGADENITEQARVGQEVPWQLFKKNSILFRSFAHKSS
jgi:hypothetical protein